MEPGTHRVLVDGQVVELESFVYLLMNKPADVVCTNDDPQGRTTYLDLLPDFEERVFPVGRLDRDSEGLLFVTNDGGLANRLMHPRYEVEKVYLATVDRGLSADEMNQFKRGLRSDDDVLRVDSVEARPSDAYHRYELRVHEGKNRHIRRMFEVLEVGVRRLKRIRFGPLTVEGIAKGMCRALTDEELKSLDL